MSWRRNLRLDEGIFRDGTMRGGGEFCAAFPFSRCACYEIRTRGQCSGVRGPQTEERLTGANGCFARLDAGYTLFGIRNKLPGVRILRKLMTRDSAALL